MSDRLNAGLHYWERVTQALVLTQSLPMGEVCLCCTQPCNLLLRSAELSFSQCIGRCRMVCGLCTIRLKAFKSVHHMGLAEAYAYSFQWQQQGSLTC